MRLSSSLFLALPFAAFAAEEAVAEQNAAEQNAEGAAGVAGAFDQYKAQFQNFLGSFGAKPAAQSEKVAQMKREQAAVEEVPVEGNALASLTMDNWHETLYGSLPQDATTPEEWWLFITGRNKTCNGRLPPLSHLSIQVRCLANEIPQATASRPRPRSTRRPPSSAP